MTKPPASFRVLIVEDEALLAMDLGAIVEDGGHRVVGEACSFDEVARMSASVAPDLAFVDVQLARGSSGIDVCALIRRRWTDAVIIFVTANPKKIPADFAGAHGVIPKPFTRNGVVSALHYIEEGVCDPPPTSPQPGSFIASPGFPARPI